MSNKIIIISKNYILDLQERNLNSNAAKAPYTSDFKTKVG
jgi:hypothetical protein